MAIHDPNQTNNDKIIYTKQYQYNYETYNFVINFMVRRGILYGQIDSIICRP